MVASPAITDRLGNRLQWAHLTLDELTEVAEEWQEMPDGERTSWSLDWDQVMGSDLPEIEQYYRCGKLTAEQRARYRDLRRRLKAALPTIERLNLFGGGLDDLFNRHAEGFERRFNDLLFYRRVSIRRQTPQQLGRAGNALLLLIVNARSGKYRGKVNLAACRRGRRGMKYGLRWGRVRVVVTERRYAFG